MTIISIIKYFNVLVTNRSNLELIIYMIYFRLHINELNVFFKNKCIR